MIKRSTIHNYLKAVKLMFTADKPLLLECLGIVLLFLGLETLTPIYMEWMINQTQTHQKLEQFLLYVLLFAIASVLLCVIDAVRVKIYAYLGKHILWQTRKQIYDVLWHSDYPTYIKNNREKFKFILSTETYLVFAITVVYTLNLIINFLTIIAFLAVAFYIHHAVALLLLTSIAAALLMSFYSGRRILSAYEACDHAREADTIMNNETVDMTEETRTNGLMNYYLGKNKATLNRFIQASAKSDQTEAFWIGTEHAIHSIIYVLIAGILILTPNSDSGQLVTILFITNYLLEVSQQFHQQLQVLIKNIPVFDKVMDAAETPIETGIALASIDEIVFDSVALRYSDEREVFHDLSFKLNRGDHVLIEGTNGSGKSSVLKMIVGLLSPTGGTICLNGKNITEYAPQSLYKEICYVSQDERLLNESVEDYLRTITHTNTANDVIADLRQKLDLSPEISRITDNGRSLSGGEKKKLLIMKSILRRDASVIIFDEIDAGLDTKTQVLMKNFEQELLKDPRKIVIKISHIDGDKSGYQKVIQMDDIK